MQDAYDELVRAASRYLRQREEAGDLVQTVVLRALERGISDLATPERRAWLQGALRRHAAFEARLAARRRRREAGWVAARVADETAARPWRFSSQFLAQLQPSIRALATLASADLNPAEIRYVLRLSGPAFRKRLSLLRRYVRDATEAAVSVVQAGGSAYALGSSRASVIESLQRRPHAVLGSHDPDGHPLIFAVHCPDDALK